MKVLFIGGTGVISSACSELCIEAGMELYVLNRGLSLRPQPRGAVHLFADIRDVAQVQEILEPYDFDVVVDWIAYQPQHVMNDFRLFRGKTRQYIFISSASAYQKPPSRLPITENEPLVNPYWSYSQAKIDCERLCIELYQRERFPVTIVRPSHTYDCTKVPLMGGPTVLYRLLHGKPIIIHGDGTSLWTLTHHRDFARGFIGLLGKTAAIGEAYHITSDEFMTWNQIAEILAEAMGVRAHVMHVPSDFIRQLDAEWGDGLLGDKAHCMFFDNSKIKAIHPSFRAEIPYQQGAEEIAAYYLADPQRLQADAMVEERTERILRRFGSHNKFFE